MTLNNTDVNYKDLTTKYINNKYLRRNTPVKEISKEIINGVIYSVSDATAVFNYTEEEKQIAKSLVKQIGGEIFMRPEITNRKSADYYWTLNGDDWELKQIHGKCIRTVDNAIKNGKDQASHFIIRRGHDSQLSNEQVKKYAKKIFSTLKREWVKTIIVLDEKMNIIGIYERK